MEWRDRALSESNPSHGAQHSPLFLLNVLYVLNSRSKVGVFCLEIKKTGSVTDGRTVPVLTRVPRSGNEVQIILGMLLFGLRSYSGRLYAQEKRYARFE